MGVERELKSERGGDGALDHFELLVLWLVGDGEFLELFFEVVQSLLVHLFLVQMSADRRAVRLLVAHGDKAKMNLQWLMGYRFKYRFGRCFK